MEISARPCGSSEVELRDWSCCLCSSFLTQTFVFSSLYLLLPWTASQTGKSAKFGICFHLPCAGLAVCLGRGPCLRDEPLSV